MKTFDAVVVGGGPAGITAVLYLVRSGCRVLLCESLTLGGQVLMTDSLANYPGMPRGVKGWELADLFAAHIEGLDFERTTAAVQGVEGSAGHFVVHTSEGDVQAKTVIAASGARHRPLGVDGEMRLAGHGVSYCAICDGNFFRGQPVAVVGGGNSALEEALYLSKIVSRVYLIHRRDQFRGAQVYQDNVRSADNIELVLSSTVESLKGDKDLEGVVVRNVATGQTRELEVNGLFIFVGMVPNTDWVPEQVEKNHGFLVTDTEMRTSVPGIFAAGDVRDKLCRQVVTAAGDGATAAQAAFLLLEQLNA
ncbi:MAG: thioredoxin-disulfide reductase [Desulfovibrionaceae bacterium]|nr:thioredoxin-disulfide reductase [Desulfovibrionaceae bacterium]